MTTREPVADCQINDSSSLFGKWEYEEDQSFKYDPKPLSAPKTAKSDCTIMSEERMGVMPPLACTGWMGLNYERDEFQIVMIGCSNDS